MLRLLLAQARARDGLPASAPVVIEMLRLHTLAGLQRSEATAISSELLTSSFASSFKKIVLHPRMRSGILSSASPAPSRKRKATVSDDASGNVKHRTPLAATPRAAPSAVIAPVMDRPASDTSPLTRNNAKGRLVLVPRRLWSSYPCSEHGGLGWEAVIRSTTLRGSARITFLTAATPTGIRYADVDLQLEVLTPL